MTDADRKRVDAIIERTKEENKLSACVHYDADVTWLIEKIRELEEEGKSHLPR